MVNDGVKKLASRSFDFFPSEALLFSVFINIYKLRITLLQVKIRKLILADNLS